MSRLYLSFDGLIDLASRLSDFRSPRAKRGLVPIAEFYRRIGGSQEADGDHEQQPNQKQASWPSSGLWGVFRIGRIGHSVTFSSTLPNSDLCSNY